jgi:GH35 family endo-1,4-beta-xylanase
MKACHFLPLLLLALPASAATAYDALWQNPALEQRIAGDIRAHRMSDAVVRCVGADGAPLANVTVRVEQTRHTFLFGANIFMLGGFPTPEENRRYEETYRRLFNYATIPFYWSDLEPEAGKPRFAKDSPVIYRRPPPDAVVEFCQQHGLAMKGHPLVWHQWFPKWRPDDPQVLTQRIEQRIADIAARYGSTIARWEVVNEPMEREKHAVAWCNLPEGYVLHALRTAQREFPASAKLMLNEATTFSWLQFSEERSPYFQHIRAMLDGGARVDEIGMQLHVFSEKSWRALLAGQQFAPRDLLKVLDRYGDFGRPLAITELTFPTLPNTPAGEADQAKVARNLYRLWFSHPRVNAISWWNLVDNTAAQGEDKWNAGLVRRDFSPKPAFTALDQLINRDWTTQVTATSAASGATSFRGFHGEYTVTAQAAGKTVQRTFTLKKGDANEWTLTF